MRLDDLQSTVINDQPGKGKRLRIVLLEDHPLVRQGVVAMLGGAGGFEICGETADPQVAMELIKTKQPDILLADIALGDADGLDTIAATRREFPDLKVLVFSGYDERIYAARALRAGASGYLCKTETHEKLIPALAEIALGRVYVSDEVAPHVMSAMNSGLGASRIQVDRLSERQLAIFTMIGKGMSTREIAENLGLDRDTVRSHRDQIRRKCNIKTAGELFLEAVSWVKGNG